MTEAFVAFVRFEEKLLLLKRNSSTEHFPDLWDGVWGVADTPEEVLERVAQSTGIPVDDLHYHATGPERGIDMGRNLVDVMPILVVATVSYTHLRAHETGRKLGFRLML